MSGDGSEFEYPDAAGYPDGMGTLHEGIDDGPDGTDADAEAAATATEGALEEFALDDEEDDEGV